MDKLINQLLHLFYPHPGNNHQAKLRQSIGVLGLICLVLAAQVWVQVFTRIQPQVLGYASNISPQQILSLTNEKRQQYGLAPLRLDQQLTHAAQAKANDMFNRDYWAHVTPTGEQPWSFITSTGYTYLYAGENLARDFADPQAVVEAWMASPSHRENLLNPNYDDLGVAVVDGDLAGVETTLIVQMFGSRRVATQPAEISETAKAVQSELPISSPTPTRQPTPTVMIAQAGLVSPTPPVGGVMARQKSSQPSQPLLTPLVINKSIGLAVAGLLSAVLLIDELVIRRKHLARITGRSWAHLVFLLTTLGILWLTNQGVIL